MLKVYNYEGNLKLCVILLQFVICDPPRNFGEILIFFRNQFINNLITNKEIPTK